MSVPVYTVDLTEAQRAFEVYALLCQNEADFPEMGQNPYFSAIKDTAYARFLMLFEAAE